MRTHESTRRLARRIKAGTARIRSATLSHQSGRWHVAFSVELPDDELPVRASGRVVGVDLGIKSLAVLSTAVLSGADVGDLSSAATRSCSRKARLRRMTEIPLRELRNDTSDVLRRVEDGERFTVTVSGRPVAQLVPLPRRKRYLTWDKLIAAQADPGLYGELREMLPDTTDDIDVPWDGVQ
ncbi:MAG: type II toxin-antitoxin system prevent-host-death family antitoxin [Pseudonocardiaceae bacterium]